MLVGEPEVQAKEKPQRKLLVVDDEPKIGYLLAEYFSRRGYEVRVVQRGEEALVLADVFQPDVVLLDLLMPGMNGIETLSQLKMLPSSPRVIMLSGADDENVARGVLQFGAHFYVCKPVDLSKLEPLVDGFLPSTATHEKLL